MPLDLGKKREYPEACCKDEDDDKVYYPTVCFSGDEAVEFYKSIPMGGKAKVEFEVVKCQENLSYPEVTLKLIYSSDPEVSEMIVSKKPGEDFDKALQEIAGM